MSQSGFTPIQLYRSTTASAVPLAADLAAGEIALNLTDEKMFFKNTGGSVVTTGTVISVGGTGSVNGITLTGTVTRSGSITIGGTLSNVSLTTQVTGTLPVGNGGSGVTTSTGSGNLVLSADATLSNVTLNDGYTEEVFAVSGTTPALSPTNGTIQTWALSGSSTPTAGTWASGQSLTLMIDDGTSFTVTWTSLAVVWKTDGGVAPLLNPVGYTVIQLWKVSTTIYGARVGNA